jgi:Putative Ig domain
MPVMIRTPLLFGFTVMPLPAVRLPFIQQARFVPVPPVIPLRVERSLYYVYHPNLVFVGTEKVIYWNNYEVVYFTPTMANIWVNNFTIGLVPYPYIPFGRRQLISQFSGASIIANLPPRINTTVPIVDKSAVKSVAMTPIIIPANAFVDPDDPVAPLMYSAYEVLYGLENPLPAWLIFNPTTRTFTGTPPVGAVGVHNISVHGADRWNRYAHDNFTITVT